MKNTFVCLLCRKRHTNLNLKTKQKQDTSKYSQQAIEVMTLIISIIITSEKKSLTDRLWLPVCGKLLIVQEIILQLFTVGEEKINARLSN